MKERTIRGHEPRMMKQRLTPMIMLVLLAPTGGCAQKVILGLDPGDGGAVGAGGAVADGGGAGAPAYTSRLTGPQPGMVAVKSAGGVTYYIDSTEVSQAAYQAFLESNPEPDPTSTTCAWKNTFQPGSDPADVDDGPGDPAACSAEQTHYDPVATPDYPVVCVDWCDAAAYCSWAGKRLCGHVGGGPTVGDELDDFAGDDGAAGGQWFSACSNAGTTPFPYGATYVEGACNGGATVAPVGSTAGCHAPTGPGVGLFDMSGNVAEWEDYCQENPFNQGGGTPGAQCCAVRGGSYGQGSPPPGPTPPGVFLLCGSPYQGEGFGFTCGSRNQHLQTTGFRCCVD